MPSPYLFGYYITGALVLSLSSHAVSASKNNGVTSTLKVVAAQRGRLIGTALSTRGFEGDKQYRDRIAHEFQLITPENALKMAKLVPERGKFEFSAADKMIQFARNHKLQVRGHCFAWHAALPDWLTTEQLPDKELEAVLTSFIATTITHFETKFPGTIRYWDVVNEAFLDDGSVRTSIWNAVGNGSLGFVEKAFLTAGRANPKLQLFYNDYGTEEINAKSNAIYELLKNLIAKGVPVHGIGFQMHLSPEKDYDFDSVRKNFTRFRKLGLKIHITELDGRIDLAAPKEIWEFQSRKQAANYYELTNICLEEPACTAILTWVLTDKYHYRSKQHPSWGNGGLLDDSFLEKSLYLELLNALKGKPN